MRLAMVVGLITIFRSRSRIIPVAVDVSVATIIITVAISIAVPSIITHMLRRAPIIDGRAFRLGGPGDAACVCATWWS